jgi:hypothetical protein
MTDPDQFIRRRLSAYSRQVSDDVRAPGTQEVYRTVKHRQQRRTTVITVACIAVVIVLLGTVVSMRRNSSVPVTVPPSASSSPVLVSPSPSSSPSLSPSPPSSPSHSPSHSSPAPSKPPASPPAPGPARRSFPVVDGSELHVVALDRVTLRPAGDHYEGTVYVDVYNSGRVPEAYNNVYLTVPGGVQEQAVGALDIGGCGIPDPPETWICNGNAVPAAGGYARTAFAVTVGILPGSSTQTITGFAVRFVARDQQNTVLTDVTPADNKAVVTLVLPPA